METTIMGYILYIETDTGSMPRFLANQPPVSGSQG